jgi:hypothetical protein
MRGAVPRRRKVEERGAPQRRSIAALRVGFSQRRVPSLPGNSFGDKDLTASIDVES